MKCMNDAIFSKVVAIRLAGGTFNLPFTGAGAGSYMAHGASTDALAGWRACLNTVIRIVLFMEGYLITHSHIYLVL